MKIKDTNKFYDFIDTNCDHLNLDLFEAFEFSDNELERICSNYSFNLNVEDCIEYIPFNLLLKNITNFPFYYALEYKEWDNKYLSQLLQVMYEWLNDNYAHYNYNNERIKDMILQVLDSKGKLTDNMRLEIDNFFKLITL